MPKATIPISELAIAFASDSANRKTLLIDPTRLTLHKPSDVVLTHFLHMPHHWVVYLSCEITEPDGSIKVHTIQVITSKERLKFPELQPFLAKAQRAHVNEFPEGKNTGLYWVASTKTLNLSPPMLDRIHKFTTLKG